MAERKHKGQPKIGTKLMRTVIFIIFAAFIILADIFLILRHEKVFSENEKRILSQVPQFTMSSLTSGKFMTEAEDFVTDQFFERDSWIALKLSIDKLRGRKESNNIYLGKQGYLLEKPDKADEEYLSRNLAAINDLADKYDLNIVMTLIPGACIVCDQLLPDNAPVENVRGIISDIRGALSESITFVDVTDALKAHQYEELYYRSDHHWKSLGAKIAFEAMGNALGIEDMIYDYAVMRVTNDFSGTMASSSGEFNIKDSIDIYVPLIDSPGVPEGTSENTMAELALSNGPEYVVEYTDTAEKTATIYVSDALDAKDKYQVFMGGNHPLVNINVNNDSSKNLLVLKDSYANTFMQFLIPYYRSITVVDPRYYNDDLYKLIRDHEISDVLILYSENNFVTDRSLFGVLEEF